MCDRWQNIEGVAVCSLTSSADYPAHPSSRVRLDSLDIPESWGSNYGTRVYGYLIPPMTGYYTFWISGDDNCELWIGTGSASSTKVLRATVPEWTNYRQFDKYSSDQQSDSLLLVGGQRYYLEALHKEGGGGDHMTVRWKLPTGVTQTPIPGSALSPLVDDIAEWTFQRRIGLNTSSSGANVSGTVLDFPVLVRLDSTNFDFTEALWFKSSTPWEWERLLLEHDEWGNAGTYQLTTFGANTVRWNFVNGTSLDGYDSLADNTWHYVAATFDSATKAHALYLDGTQVASGTAPNQIGSSDGPTYIGSRGGSTMFFPGAIDEVRIEQTPRSSDWMKLCYQNQMPGQTLVTFPDDVSLNSFAHHQHIYLNTSSTGANVADGVARFPLLVSFSDASFDFSQVRAGGPDIRFATSTGKVLHHDIEQWDSVRSQGAIWILLDTLKGNNATQYIEMHWGHATAPCAANSRAVFSRNNGFAGVWHLSDRCDSVGTLSAFSNAAGTARGDAYVDAPSRRGIAARGQEFDNDYIALSDGDNFGLDSSFSMDTWVNSTASNWPWWMHVWGDWTGMPAAEMAIREGKVYLAVREKTSTGEASNNVWGSTTLSAGAWNHVAVTFRNGTMKAYLNGVLDATTTDNTVNTINNSGNHKFIGAKNDSPDFPFYGSIDEFRISAVQRSTAWMKMCFESQRPGQALVSFENVRMADDDGDGIPDGAETALGGQASPEEVARPSAWANNSAAQIITYDFSNIRGFEQYDSVLIEAPAGVIEGSLNPIIRVVPDTASEFPAFVVPGGQVACGKYEARFALGTGDSLMIPFPVSQNFLDTHFVSIAHVFHYDTAGTQWEELKSYRSPENVVYGLAGANQQYVLTTDTAAYAETSYVYQGQRTTIRARDPKTFWARYSARDDTITFTSETWSNGTGEIHTLHGIVHLTKLPGIWNLIWIHDPAWWYGIYDTLEDPSQRWMFFSPSADTTVYVPEVRVIYNDNGVVDTMLWGLVPGENTVSLSVREPWTQQLLNQSITVTYDTTDEHTIVYVDSARDTGAHTGTSWTNAYSNLSQALRAHQHSTKQVDFWIAKGTYLPTTDTARDSTFRMPPYSRLLGGFVGNETSESQRSPREHPTVLSGDIGVAGTRTDNVYHVVTGAHYAALDGFTVYDGYGDIPNAVGDDTARVQGAGLRAVNTPGMLVENCIFRHNKNLDGYYTRGGAIYAQNATNLQVRACHFEDNVSHVYDNANSNAEGGGIALRQCSGARITECSFVNNSSPHGGGLSTGAGTRVENCVFYHNTAGYPGQWASGGALKMETGSNAINCTFLNNNAYNAGGSIEASGACTLSNSLIWGSYTDTPYKGQAVEIQTGPFTIRRCAVQGGLDTSGLHPPIGTMYAWGGLRDSGGNISAYPAFADTASLAAGADSIWATLDDGLGLLGLSPCLNRCPTAGAPGVDIVGIERPQGDSVDMGAYESYVVSVSITNPAHDTVVNHSPMLVSFERNGGADDSTVSLQEGPNEIVVAAWGPGGQSWASDTVTITLDTQGPVVHIARPSCDTLVRDSLLSVHYEIDSTEFDTVLTLVEGLNAFIPSDTDAVGNRGADTLYVIYATIGIDSIDLVAVVPESVFAYQYLYLDARGTKAPVNVPLLITWRQIDGDSVYNPWADQPVCRVLARDVDTLQFEVHVADVGGIIEKTDTVSTVVVWPQSMLDYLAVLRTKTVHDNGVEFRATRPTLDGTWSCADTSLTLSGTVGYASTIDTLLWSVESNSGVDTGRVTVTGGGWIIDSLPLGEGDNWVTCVYARVDGLVAAEHLLISRAPGIHIGDFAIDPDMFIIDSTQDFHASARIEAIGITQVDLVRMVGGNETSVAQLYDDGMHPDSISGDSLFGGAFTLQPKEDSVYTYRVKMQNAEGTFYGATRTFYPRVELTESVLTQAKWTIYYADTLYRRLKVTLGDSLEAMAATAESLMQRPEIIMAGRAAGRDGVCLELASGIWGMVSDGPAGTKGNPRFKAKGVAPFYYDSEFGWRDDLRDGQAWGFLKRDTICFDTDSLQVNEFAEVPIQNVRRSDFQNWGEYKTVVVSAHGSTFGYDHQPRPQWRPFVDIDPGPSRVPWDPIVMLYSNIRPLPGDLVDLSPDLGGYATSRAKLATCDHQYMPNLVLVAYPGDTTPMLGITPGYFNKYCKNLDSSLVYISACRSLYNNSLWDVLHYNGAAAMLGYTDYVAQRFSGDMGRTVYSKLAAGAELRTALDSALAYAAGTANMPEEYPNDSLGNPRHWFVVKGCPADGPDSVRRDGLNMLPNYPSLFQMRGDSNFCFHDYYPIKLAPDTADSGANPRAVVDMRNVYQGGIPGIKQGDSITFVSDPKGKKIPMRLKLDKVLNLDVCTTWICPGSGVGYGIDTTKNLHAKAVYLSINSSAYPPHSSSSSATDFKVTLYLRTPTGSYDTLTTNLTAGKHFRNYKKTDTLGCPHNDAQKPTSDSSFVIYPRDPENATVFMDVMRIDIPYSKHDCVLKEIVLMTAHDADAGRYPARCDGQPSDYIPNKIRINAITVESYNRLHE